MGRVTVALAGWTLPILAQQGEALASRADSSGYLLIGFALSVLGILGTARQNRKKRDGRPLTEPGRAVQDPRSCQTQLH